MKPGILVVLGTRPEAIKLAPVILSLKQTGKFRVTVCATGQHRQMVAQVLPAFGIVPDIDLKVMRHDQDQFGLVSKILLQLKSVIASVKPEMLVVQGDTTTAFISAFAAFHCKVSIAHVEAGLRTNDKYSPFPEEVNRRLIACVADLHFAPTGASRSNLVREGVPPKKVFVTGNTSIDALLAVRDRLAVGDIAGRLPAAIRGIDRKIILVTAHRRESFGKSFRDMCGAVRDLARKNPDVEIVYPVHLNPNVQAAVKSVLSDTPRIHLVEPLDYVSFVELMTRAHFILTDSGGIQEEAPALDKPVLVMRKVTERGEAVRTGAVRLVGVSRDAILRDAQLLLDSRAEYSRMAKARNPYGDGRAAFRIADVLAASMCK